MFLRLYEIFQDHWPCAKALQVEHDFIHVQRFRHPNPYRLWRDALDHGIRFRQMVAVSICFRIVDEMNIFFAQNRFHLRIVIRPHHPATINTEYGPLLLWHSAHGSCRIVLMDQHFVVHEYMVQARSIGGVNFSAISFVGLSRLERIFAENDDSHMETSVKPAHLYSSHHASSDRTLP